MKQIIAFSQIVISILLVVSILLQNKGAGLSQTFGGDFGGYYTKRGMEKFLAYFSIALSTLFILSAILSLIIGKNS
ncbi:MAG: preprotein translocase subunit SecG [Patescibacteria group bacterium]